MKNKDKANREVAKEQAQEAAKRLFVHRTEEQNKALEDVKTLGSPKNIIKRDSELFDDDETK
jgi:hypothetical protein